MTTFRVHPTAHLCGCDRCSQWTGEVVQSHPFTIVCWSKGSLERVRWTLNATELSRFGVLPWSVGDRTMFMVDGQTHGCVVEDVQSDGVRCAVRMRARGLEQPVGFECNLADLDAAGIDRP